MVTALIAGLVMQAQPKDILAGVWRSGSGQVYECYSGSGAVFAKGERFGYLDKIGKVPNGSYLGFWATYGAPTAVVATGGLRAGASPTERTPGPGGVVRGLGRAYQGTWRAVLSKFDDRGYPVEARLEVQALNEGEPTRTTLTYVCDIGDARIEGVYQADNIRLEIARKSRFVLSGKLRSFGRDYVLRSDSLSSLPSFEMQNPGNGARVGTLYALWNPTSAVIDQLSTGKKMPTDRVLVCIEAEDSKQKTPIVRNLILSK